MKLLLLLLIIEQCIRKHSTRFYNIVKKGNKLKEQVIQCHVHCSTKY